MELVFNLIVLTKLSKTILVQLFASTIYIVLSTISVFPTVAVVRQGMSGDTNHVFPRRAPQHKDLHRAAAEQKSITSLLLAILR